MFRWRCFRTSRVPWRILSFWMTFRCFSRSFWYFWSFWSSRYKSWSYFWSSSWSYSWFSSCSCLWLKFWSSSRSCWWIRTSFCSFWWFWSSFCSCIWWLIFWLNSCLIYWLNLWIFRLIERAFSRLISWSSSILIFCLRPFIKLRNLNLILIPFKICSFSKLFL